MENAYLIAIISWFLPGAGHLIQRRLKRGLIIGAVIWAMFIVAVLSGGAYYPGFDYKDGQLLYLLNVFARAGNGLGALISFYLMAEPPKFVASWATFEYGGRFLEVAGLLNFMAVLDAFDLGVGRKQ